MSDNKTDQIGNVVEGDQAARDIHKTYNITTSNESQNLMQILDERFRQEAESDPKLQAFIDELDHFNSSVDTDVIGLEEKFKKANYEAYTDYALRKKEQYYKLLEKYQFSEVAQRINLYLLALVETRFMDMVYPRLLEGASIAEIQRLIQEEIVDRVMNQLGPNTLFITPSHVLGMLYLLTGNCHVKWHK